MTVQPHERKNGTSKTAVHHIPEKKELPGKLAFVEACPFLGLADDPDTRLLFVSPAGCCHRAEPVANVDSEHQNSHCLTAQHTLCPVFVRPEWDLLPPDLAYHQPEVRTRHLWLWGVLGLVVIGVLIGGFMISGNGGAAVVDTAPEFTPLPVVASLDQEPTETTTPAPTHTLTKTAVPTDTRLPSPTASPQPPSTATTQPTATLVPTYTPVVPVVPTETAVPPALAEVIVPLLNIRTGPGTDYELLFTVNKGDELELIGRTSDGSWWQICCVSDEVGWIIGEAVQLPPNVLDRVEIVTVPTLPATSPEN